ncbi:MAG: FKBP-type peptidyl-prolyl cis-trans isomerase [SAR324 cluster bacterium]|nr:FKBP-type peptidyl-prolyl cis-trans isomerase [SAR324 cluster bacterium]
MKHIFLGLLFSLIVVKGVLGQEFKQQSSYIIGYNLGNSLSESGIEVELKSLIKGVNQGLSGKDSRYSDDKTKQIMVSLNDKAKKNIQSKQKKMSIQNTNEASDFLAKNKSKAGVKETASGLQYEIMKDASGKKPSSKDQVKVHYVGTLIDGSEFDSSVKRGTPAEFGLDQVISGWTEGVQLMSIGAKYRFFVPPALGYGNSAPPGSIIGPGALLIFEVELLGINGKDS